MCTQYPAVSMFLVSNKLCESDKFQPAAAVLIKLPVSQVLSKYMPMHFYCYYIYPVDINISRVKGQFFHTLQKKNIQNKLCFQKIPKCIQRAPGQHSDFSHLNGHLLEPNLRFCTITTEKTETFLLFYCAIVLVWGFSISQS